MIFCTKVSKSEPAELDLESCSIIHKVTTQKRKIINKENIRNPKNFDELLDIKNEKIVSKKRDGFEEKTQYFEISKILKEARKEANMTQEQLADKVGNKKSYISRLENGKCDIQLSTLFRIFEFKVLKSHSLRVLIQYQIF